MALLGGYNAENRQHVRLGRTGPRVDRRLISKVRGAFDRGTDRADEPCHLSCTGCGALTAPAAVGPHRDGLASIEACRHCGTRSLIDLTEDDATRGLATVEDYEIQTVHRGRRALGWMVRFGGAAAMITICYFAIAGSYSAIFSGLTALLCLMAVPYFLLGYGRATRVERRKLPYRWALPLPPSTEVAADAPAIRGRVEAPDTPLVAPLTGRPCVGFRVVVRREDAPPNAAASLVAQRCSELRVDGRPVRSDTVRLDLPTSVVRLDETHKSAAVAYLRRHGIIEREGPWVLEEGVLEAADDVSVHAAEGPGLVLRVS